MIKEKNVKKKRKSARVDILTFSDPQKKSYAYWIGSHDVEVEGQFIWTSSRNRITYTDWWPGIFTSLKRGILKFTHHDKIDCGIVI